MSDARGNWRGVQTAGAKSEGNCHLLPKGPGASRASRAAGSAGNLQQGQSPEGTLWGRGKPEPFTMAPSREAPLPGLLRARNWGTSQQMSHSP